MEPVDYLRSGAIVFAFLFTSFGSRNTWLKADACFFGVFGLGFIFFPEVLAEFQVDGKLDSVHLLYMRFFGCMALFPALTSVLVRHSEDDNVWSSHLLARALAGPLVLANLAYAWYNYTSPGLTVQALSFGGLASLLHFIGNVYQLFTYGKSEYGYWNNGLKVDRLTRHILFDALMGFVLVFFNFAYAETMVASITIQGFKPDGIHYTLYRHFAAARVVCQFIIMSAVGYAEEEDKKKTILAKIIITVLVTVVMIGSQLMVHFLERNLIIAIIVTEGLLIGNLTAAYYCKSSY